MATEFQSLKNEYLEYCQDRMFSEKTIENRRQILDKLEGYLPESLVSIQPSHIYHWLHSMDKSGLKKSTSNTYLRYGKAMFNYALMNGSLNKNPLARFGLKTQQTQTTPPPDEALLRAVEASRDNQLHYPLMLVLYENGLKIGEVATLNKNDLDLERKSLIIQSKNRKRMVRLSNYCWITIMNYLDSRLDDEAKMFVTKNGRALSQNSIATIIWKYGQIAGITSLNCQHFRKALIVRQNYNHVNIEDIALNLGYRDLNTVFHVIRDFSIHSNPYLHSDFN